jgi:short-subunit dehydrogenase involved in D-alanine esterification of teichoic acids
MNVFDNVTVVTGGASGIGLGLRTRFAEDELDALSFPPAA